jgi:two-component system sensor histidine kinase RegB
MVTASVLVAAIEDSFPSACLETEFSTAGREAHLAVPRHAVEQALIALVRNALEASPQGEPVRLNVGDSGGSSVIFQIKDCGSGMSPESLRHAGEPFYTTKPPGKGMGLGIFLVRTLADRLGGKLTLESSGAGTTATLELPLARVAEPVAI